MSLVLIASIIISLNQFNSNECDNLWGTAETDFIKNISSNSYYIFKPKDKPDYDNKITDFFSSLNDDTRIDIDIIHVSRIPETDYCFFNRKLYSINENLGTISDQQCDAIKTKILREYKESGIIQKGSFTVSRYAKGKTKILLYKKPAGLNTSQCIILYYSSDIFSLLFADD